MPEPTPEARERARKANQVGHAELIRERGWSEADAAFAQRCGLLPQGGDCGGARLIIGQDGYARGRQVYYSRERLAERAVELKNFVKRLK